MNVLGLNAYHRDVSAALVPRRKLIAAVEGERFRRIKHITRLPHPASAAFVSPFDRAAVCAIDGFGDFVSTSWGQVEGMRLDVRERVYFPHSLGLLYLALTQYLGFPDYGDEFKVMGLAPYGESRYVR